MHSLSLEIISKYQLIVDTKILISKELNKFNPLIFNVLSHYFFNYSTLDSHSLLKVASVDQDSVYVISNDYETERQSDLNDLDKASNFTSKPYGISKEDLKEYFKSKKILDVNRD